ncbi:putative BTB domain-containing protein [Seiridium cardinale]
MPYSGLPTSTARVMIDPDGDLHLRVGTNKCCGTARTNHEHIQSTLFVCESKTLSRASRVWRVMLYGQHWKESRSSNDPASGEWIVDLPEDDPGAMTIILNIIHSRFENFPIDEDINSSRLYELTVLTDKYDLTKVLRPWAKNWLRPLHALYPQGWMRSQTRIPPLFSTTLTKHLWIAWELGDRVLLQNTLKDMILHGQFLSFGIKAPPGLLDKAEATHASSVLYVLTEYQKAVAGFLTENRNSTPEKDIQCSLKDRKCHFIMLGSMITSLSHIGLWPLPKSTSYKGSIHQLLTQLSTLNLENADGLLVECDFSSNGIFGASSTGLNYPLRNSGIGTSIFGFPATVPPLGTPMTNGNTNILRKVLYRPKAKDGHCACHPVPRGRTTLKSALNLISVELDKSHLKHLRDRAAKTGLST